MRWTVLISNRLPAALKAARAFATRTASRIGEPIAPAVNLVILAAVIVTVVAGIWLAVTHLPLP